MVSSTVGDAYRLSDYSVNVSGDYVIFKTVHRLNLIRSPYDLNYLNKTKRFNDIKILCALGTVRCPVSVVLVVVVTMTGFDLWDSTKSCSACVELM